MAEQGNITPEQMQKMMAGMAEIFGKQMAEAIKEIKKPTEAEQKKLDKEEKELRAKQELRFKMQKAEIDSREARKQNCPHGTAHPGNGSFSHAWRAQVNTPAGEEPYFIPMCTQCQTQLPKILATPDQVRNGVNLNAYPGLTMKGLEQWAASQQAVAV